MKISPRKYPTDILYYSGHYQTTFCVNMWVHIWKQTWASLVTKAISRKGDHPYWHLWTQNTTFQIQIMVVQRHI